MAHPTATGCTIFQIDDTDSYLVRADSFISRLEEMGHREAHDEQLIGSFREATEKAITKARHSQRGPDGKFAPKKKTAASLSLPWKSSGSVHPRMRDTSTDHTHSSAYAPYDG